MTGEQQQQRAEDAPTTAATTSAATSAAAARVVAPTDAEWEARLDALGQLANTDAVSALEQAQQAVEELRGQQRLDLESRLTGILGHCYLALGQKVEAAVALHRAISIARAIGRVDLEVHHLATLGLAEARLGAFSDSIGCYERALSLHQNLPSSPDNDLLRARALASFGSTYFYMGLLDKALAAPARPGREMADEGRRMEIRDRLAKL